MYTLMTTPARIINRMSEDRFLRPFFHYSDGFGPGMFRVDVKEEPERYVLEAELPGVKQDAIDITVEDDVLTIAATMNVERKEEKANYLYSERRAGSFRRSFNVESIRQEDIEAVVEDGILRVTLPKKQAEPAQTQRRVPIQKPEKAKPAE